MGGITAALAYKANHFDHAMLASLAIPTALLMSPVVGYYHLVLLTFNLEYFFEIGNRIPWVLKIIFHVFLCNKHYSFKIRFLCERPFNFLGRIDLVAELSTNEKAEKKWKYWEAII
jgi:hypothetical protein